jgi:hypothetical protein
MALIACPECKRKVSESAASCPKCGWKVTPEYLAQHRRERARAKKLEAIVGAALVGLFLIGAIVGPNAKTSSRSRSAAPAEAKPKRRGDPISAFVMSQEFVKRALKSPSTADFPWFDRSFVSKLGEGRYHVSAYVDAKNAFGAELRSRYTCVVTTDDGDSWSLESIDIQ